MGMTGDLCEIPGDKKFEWKIKDFLLLPDKINTCCASPLFDFCGASWGIRIFSNGQAVYGTEGWIGLYLAPISSDIPVSADFSFSLKSVDGKIYFDRRATCIFLSEKGIANGWPKFVQRSELIERKSQLLPSGILTVICTMKVTDKKEADGNGDSKKTCIDVFAQTNEGIGVWELQHHLREIFLNGNLSDVVLKVDDQEFKSHSCILGARSPVFLAMLTHETKEKNSSVVDIPDADPNTFSSFLNYLYTGSKENVTSHNVLELYTAADKYQVDDLRKVCVDYMLQNMSVDNFCDFLTLSLKHVEKDLTDACSQFFIDNTLDIIITSKWQVFISENPIAGNELHIKYIKQSQLNK